MRSSSSLPRNSSLRSRDVFDESPRLGPPWRSIKAAPSRFGRPRSLVTARSDRCACSAPMGQRCQTESMTSDRSVLNLSCPDRPVASCTRPLNSSLSAAAILRKPRNTTITTRAFFRACAIQSRACFALSESGSTSAPVIDAKSITSNINPNNQQPRLRLINEQPRLRPLQLLMPKPTRSRQQTRHAALIAQLEGVFVALGSAGVHEAADAGVDQ